MGVYYGTLTSKGQTTVPVEVRNLLNLKPGDKIRYIHRNGEIVMKAKNRRAIDLAGRFHDPARPSFTLDEVDDVVGQAIVERLTEPK
ncbi:AbrB/MazE/SpoVT family DNA-binding domain-containing protein [Metarhizobium album]|uniref:AbrB/MazE/SpoVT family DNA-binding domain-containing protein n=1 Tax=Metarhizobium album TaxID=2182425 RepID=A0A2U2DV63_9HYPH|nr:type II toxin-antitoxin system PrlF family antitoxin [Rhizobium album]PWE57194.1 AbrB/MazE/SpoVT family DNA-binding domain-containing protein [Rhizobium album]